MNFDHAKQAMLDGHKVKLPEWTGYWFGDGPNIKVFTKNGDILDTPHIDKYKDRDDWMILYGGLGFDFAILALQNGKKVQRAGWNGKGQFVVMAGGYSVELDKLRPGTHISKEFLESKGCDAMEITRHLDLWNAQRQYVPGWVPSQGDLFAKDWQLVD